jgi:hypothetical protein
MMNRFVFAWDSTDSVYLPGDRNDGWSFDQDAVDSDTIFILFAASGKTGLAFAYNLKFNRPTNKKPREVIAEGSLVSKAFTEGIGLFDKVLPYDADHSDLATMLGLASTSKIILCDFGGRDGAIHRWAAKLSQGSQKVLLISVGGEVVADSPEKTTKKFMSRMAPGLAGIQKLQVNASILRIQAMDILGERQYFEGFLKEWNLFKERGGIKGLRLIWGEGMDDVATGWKRLCSGEVGPDEGLLYELKVEAKGLLG